MTQERGNEQLAEDRRKEVFLALVEAQDHEMDVAQSRTLVAQRFGVRERRVRQIEQEGFNSSGLPCDLRKALASVPLSNRSWGRIP
jgi:hypothetical protein